MADRVHVLGTVVCCGNVTFGKDCTLIETAICTNIKVILLLKRDGNLIQFSSRQNLRILDLISGSRDADCKVEEVCEACCLGFGSLCINVVKCSEVLELLVRCF
jgi:hypothetical protein